MLDSRPLGTFPEYTGTSADKASSLVDEIDEDALLFTHVSSRTVLVPRVQSMQEYILKHHKRMVLSALNQQIRSGMLWRYEEARGWKGENLSCAYFGYCWRHRA